MKLGRSRRHQAYQLTDRRVEAIGKSDQDVALLGFAPSLQLCLLRLQCSRSHRGLAQRLQRFCHAADQIAAFGFADHLIERPVGDPLHPALLSPQCAEDVTRDQPRQQTHQRRHPRTDRAQADQQRVDVGVEVIDVEAVAHRHIPRREFAYEKHFSNRNGLPGAGKEIGCRTPSGLCSAAAMILGAISSPSASFE